MSYQVLARKWRPKNFSEMVGQEAVVQTLSNALEQDRLHHAYLFTGTRGVGKTTIARIIGKCLNCEKGITAEPCGQCDACTAIDKSQFVDLIEVDAASRTKVEDTRELLDNVQYAPSQGRFKVYLIDEVHMLSGHSFNALLKTLEEPPEHVKFLLATTEPQKLPITVLSRCLQFHLKGMMPEMISQHLQHILKTEEIKYQEDALIQIAEAANGSMRDALSLLDQAIAFSNANITEQAARDLLGTTADTELYPLLDALLTLDGENLFQSIEKLAYQGVNFTQVLTDFLMLLHRISLLQTVPELASEKDQSLQPYRQQFSKEDIQLFYQIGLIGQRDLPFAPTLRSGFEMVLLRMLNFVPQEQQQLSPKTESHPKQNKKFATKNSTEDWPTIVTNLELKGMSKTLAQNCVLKSMDKEHVHLQIDRGHASLVTDKLQAQLMKNLQQHLSSNIKLTIDVETVQQETPAKQIERQNSEKQQIAKNNLIEDPHVQSILRDFGGSIDENSIKSLKP